MNQEQQRLADIIMEELSHGERQFFDALSGSEKLVALDVLRGMREDASGGVPLLDALWDVDYERKPVDIETFLTHPDYLGMEVIRSLDDESRTSGVFEQWYHVLRDLFSPSKQYWELILSCSIGTGKSAVAALAMAYKIYRLSCLRDPQKFYGLLPGHSIIFGVCTVFKYKAKELAGDYLRKAIDSCPYFKDVFPINDKKTHDIQFPKSVSVIYGASNVHLLGANVFSVLIDETDFMKAGASAEDKGQAYGIYTSVLRRMESRFMRGGEIPGILIQISSKASADAYLAERIKSRGGTDKALVIEKTAWEVKPWRYTKARFPVFIGDSYSDPRIIGDGEDLGLDMSRIIQVPEEHRLPFQEDIHGALRDLANVATGSATPLIPRRDRIFACVNPNRKHPFTMTDFHIGLDDDLAIEDFLDLDAIVIPRKSTFVPLVRPGVKRYIHIDLAVSGDALGFSMGHISDFQVVTRADANEPTHTHEFKVPKIYIDMAVRVMPKLGSKIRLSSIRDFVFALRGYGFNIAKVTADTYQSTDLIQQLIRGGITAEVLSVDIAREKTGHPYAFLREATMEGRIDYYQHDQLLAEMSNLQRLDIVSGGKIKWKVDHPAKMNDVTGSPVKGAKDVADAVCGVAYHCMMQEIEDDESPISMPQVIAKPKPTGRRFLAGDSWVVGDYNP